MPASRYWRVTSLTTGERSVGSIKLRTTVGGPNLATTGNGTASASSYWALYGGYPASKAFDGNDNSQWTSDDAGYEWIQWDFGVGVSQDIQVITLTNGSEYEATNFTSAVFSYSDDGSTFTELFSIYSRPTTTYYSETYLAPNIITAAIVAPMGSLSASATIYVTGTADIALVGPSPKLAAAFGGWSKLTNPTFSLSASASQKVNGAILTAPSPSLSSAFGGFAKLQAPAFALTANATGTNIAQASLTCPSPLLSATGKVSGSAQASLQPPMGSLIGYSGAVISMTLADKPIISSSVTVGSVAGAVLTCPLFQLTSTATAQNHGGAILTAPMGKLGGGSVAYLIAPMGKLTAIGSAVVSVTYEAYSVNLGHKDPESNNEVTRYTNYPFDRIVRYKNSYFGMNSTGLYLLDSGALDNGAAIPYEMQTHETDFGVPEQKTVVSAYFGGKLGPAEKVTLFVGEKSTKPYSYTTPRGAKPQTYRQVFGKGIKDRYYAIGVSGNKEFELDTVDFEVAKLKRRI